MKKIIIVSVALLLVLVLVYSLKNTEQDLNQDKQYKFIKNYTITVTVGGIVGIRDKSYKIGDIVTGKETSSGIDVRIAPHYAYNELEPNPASYQEFITIPIEYLQQRSRLAQLLGI